MTNFLLNNGSRIPVIGLGASIVSRQKTHAAEHDAKKQMDIYMYAMKKYPGLCYDTSSSYGLNESILGQAMKETGSRNSLYLSVKISNHEQRQGDIRKAIENHLNTLQTDHVDMLMLHWPHPGTFIKAYKVIEQLYKEGYADSLGVSNFHRHHIEKLMKHASILPAVNQIEVHPLFTQKPLIDWCKSLDIRIMAYSPLGRMHDVLVKSKILRTLSQKYGKTVPQVILRWDFEKGLISIPRTCTPAHLDEFMDIFDFKLLDDEIKAIDNVNENIRLRFNPDTVDYTVV